MKVNDKIYGFLQETQKRINHIYGGAGSGKSTTIGQFMLLEKFLLEEDIRMLLVRETRPALKKSQWLLINDLLNQHNISDLAKRHYGIEIKRNLSDLTIYTQNNAMFFVPLDDVEKLKSFEKINYIWAEEATTLHFTDYIQLNLRCRGKNVNGINQLYFSYNPIDENSFLKDIVDDPPDDVAICHSTCEDNAFLEPEYIKVLEQLREQDPTYHKIYRLGLWATPEHIIYTNWDIVQEWPKPDWFDECIIGVDFGWNNPSAAVEVGVKDQEYWLRELIYESKLTKSDFATKLFDILDDKDLQCYADSAEPDGIEDLKRAGLIAKGAKKGKGSVRAGIDFLKRFKTHVHHESTNLIKEKRGYKWREDRNGNILDEPVAFKDHALDAWRYGEYTHFADRVESRLRWVA